MCICKSCTLCAEQGSQVKLLLYPTGEQKGQELESISKLVPNLQR